MTNCITLDTTLRELMNMVPDTTNIEVPTPRALRDDVTLLIKVDFSDGTMEVYENGFFIYSAKQRSAVVRVHDCASGYYYEYADGKTNSFSENFWMDVPFATRLAIEGERHLDMNSDRRVRKHLSSYDSYVQKAACRWYWNNSKLLKIGCIEKMHPIFFCYPLTNGTYGDPVVKGRST